LGIDEKMIPAGAVIHYKQPTFWEMYRTGAVQTSADAADLILQSGGDRHADLIRIVTRIRSDTLRASDVIRRLRNLLAKQTPERSPFEAGAAMTDVAMMLRPEAERRKIILDTRPGVEALHIQGDRTQIQQVLINLVLNAMDAVADLPESRRHVEVLMEGRAANVLMTVRDHGQGIALENLPKLFDSFFVETHGGRIWAQNSEASGAAFFVELPTPAGPAVSLSAAT
jgi:C4-dicarboxylate-specific signal transduction histidine kinase